MLNLLQEPVSKIIVAVLAGILLLLITAYIQKRKLTIVVPKVFSHTLLTDNGSAYMLSLYNRGVKTEENIRIQLKKNNDYSLMATTDASVELSDDTVSLSRLNAGDELNIVLLVEGNEFDHSSIIKLSSDETKGSVVDTVDKVPASAKNMIGGSILICFFFIGFPALTGLFGYSIGKDAPLYASTEKLLENTPEQLNNVEWENLTAFIKSDYFREDRSRKFPIEIVEQRDLRGSASVKLRFWNDGDKRMEFSARLTSAAEEQNGPTIDIGEYFRHGLLVFPGESRIVELKVNKPDTIKNKSVLVNVNFSYNSDTTYNLEKVLWIE